MVADIRFILYSVVWLSVWSGTLLYIFLDSNILYTWPVHPVSRILRLVFGFEIYSHLNYIPNFFTWNIIEVVQWHYSLYLYIRSSMFPYNVLIVFFSVAGKWCPRREWSSPTDARAASDAARRGVLYSSVFLGSPGKSNIFYAQPNIRALNYNNRSIIQVVKERIL